MLVGQAHGLATMLLLIIRFLAPSEAFRKPGNIHSGLHQIVLMDRTPNVRVISPSHSLTGDNHLSH